jgi:cobyrinic acid a,c-diamide synthase
MRLKKNINLQLEKSFEHLPLINRSEMDALYKTIYDLKKQVAELVKMNKAAMVARTEAVKATETASEASAPKATAKSSAKKA